MLIKDNHIALAGGIRTAIERAKAHAGHLVKIEVEVDTLAQLEQVLALGVDAVLLDNMTTDELRQAVAMTDGRAITEASGRITAATVRAIAETGVDLISAGWLTHSSAALDIGLDYLEGQRNCAARRRRSLRRLRPEPVRAALRDAARGQPFGLEHRERQHDDRDRLMRQSQIDRHLMQQRQDAERGLQQDRRHQPPGAADRRQQPARDRTASMACSTASANSA